MVLEVLGLSDQDESVYCLTLLHPGWSLGRSAKELGLRPQQLAESHQRLIDRGFLERHPTDPERVVPRGPDSVLDTLLAQEEARAACRRAEMAQARERLSALVQSYLAASADRQHLDVEYFDAVDAVRLRLAGLARATDREVLSLHPGAAQSAESIRACLPLDRWALRRGITMRAIYLHDAMGDPATWSYIEEVAAAGAQVRLTAQLPTRLTIIDRAVAVVPAVQHASGGSALVIRGTGVITALVALFEQSWTSAQPLRLRDSGVPLALSGEDQPPSDNDRVLLRLLSLGLKDEAVARHLGVSVRTTRRQIADLLLRLQANSRFQAGIQAARRGWL